MPTLINQWPEEDKKQHLFVGFYLTASITCRFLVGHKLGIVTAT